MEKDSWFTQVLSSDLTEEGSWLTQVLRFDLTEEGSGLPKFQTLILRKRVSGSNFEKEGLRERSHFFLVSRVPGFDFNGNRSLFPYASSTGL